MTNAGNTVNYRFLYGTPNAKTHSYVGSPASPMDPKLLPPVNNGGPTMTCALQSDSLAVDHGANSLALPYDQRGMGYVRLSGVAVDIGAYEYGSGAPAGSLGSVFFIRQERLTAP